MKHNLRITILILAMFILAQFIGIFVISTDPFTIHQTVNNTVQNVTNPYLTWINPPPAQTQGDFNSYFSSLIIAFVIAILLLFFLMKFKGSVLLKIWFLAVITIALLLSFTAFEKLLNWNLNPGIVFVFTLIFSFFLAMIKVYRRNFFVHNITELLIYPGIASVFVPILNIYTVIGLLIIISIYDIWAVWHSGIMQKMAKYQINHLKIFSGFFVPYMSKKVHSQIKSWKKKLSKSQLRKKKIKVNVAILGGGDVVFPIITAGVMLKTLGLESAIFVVIGATLGLSYLFFVAEKKKFYPAMPFITAGILAAILASYILL